MIYSFLMSANILKIIIYIWIDLIEEVLETNSLFVKPETFNFKEWSEESFGVYHRDEKITVEVIFSPKVSPFSTFSLVKG